MSSHVQNIPDNRITMRITTISVISTKRSINTRARSIAINPLRAVCGEAACVRRRQIQLDGAYHVAHVHVRGEHPRRHGLLARRRRRRLLGLSAVVLKRVCEATVPGQVLVLETERKKDTALKSAEL